MKCTRYEPSLLLHAHGQLSGVERLWIEAHLQGCPPCRIKWARFAAEKERLRQHLHPVPAENGRLVELVGARIRREGRALAPARGSGGNPGQVLALAILAALLAVALSALAAFWGPLARSNAGVVRIDTPPAGEGCAPAHPVPVGPPAADGTIRRLPARGGARPVAPGASRLKKPDVPRY